MVIVLDTNVFMSGIFWSGPPYAILEAWKDKKLKLAMSLEILDEYSRVGNLLEKKYKGVKLSHFIDLIIKYGIFYEPVKLTAPVTKDIDDDKFIACALSANCRLIVSGDKHLLDVSGYQDIEVLKPAQFVNAYLKS